MRECLLLVDFGSTFTKLCLVERATGRYVDSLQTPTTVQTDITVGYRIAAERLLAAWSDVEVNEVLASSSAAGGLGLVAIGLVPGLTVEAARMAALGAGARLRGAFSYKLNEDDCREIIALQPDLILVTGGTDGGNESVLLWNADVLAELPLDCPILVAGNKVVSGRAEKRLAAAGKQVCRCDNVLPSLDRLNVEPARHEIRRIFIDHIVRAKGFDRAQQLSGRIIMPTPMAVLRGAEFVSRTIWNGQGVMVVDVGGATTDVYSIGEGAPSTGNVIRLGLPEPLSKRTVEGDLGIRVNALNVFNLATTSADGEPLIDLRGNDVLAEYTRKVSTSTEYLPMTEAEREMDVLLAQAAVRIAARRHAGRWEKVAIPGGGMATVQRGKDLSSFGFVVGTGGILARNVDAAQDILAGCTLDKRDPWTRLPEAPQLVRDEKYLLYAIGLLSTEDEDAAAGLVDSSGLATLAPPRTFLRSATNR